MLRAYQVLSIAIAAVLVCPNPLIAASRSRLPARRKSVVNRTSKEQIALSRPQQRKPVPASIEKVALDIPDLKTVENVGAVTAALQRLPGVHSAVIDLKIHLAVVDFNPTRTRLSEFLAACKEAGFEAEEYRVESRFPKPIKLKGG